MFHTKLSHTKLLIGLMLPFVAYMHTNSSFASQADIFTQPLPDRAKYSCKFCPEPDEAEKTLEAGLAFNSSDKAKANEYNGRAGNPIIPLIDGSYSAISDEGRFLTLWTRHLGDASREVSLTTGEYGNYEIDLNYDQLSRYQFNDLRTPFSDIDSTDLGLATGNATTDIEQDRMRFALGMNKVITTKWQAILDYNIENKTGLKNQGAAVYPSFAGARSVMLPVPIDQTTQLLKLGLGYQSTFLQIEAGYKGSFFKNANDALTWENPHTSSSAVDTDKGRIALAPDNQFHQLYAIGALRPVKWLKLKGQIAAGRMLQDQDFIDYTVNSALTNPALPRSSLDGQVNTLQGNVRGTIDIKKNLVLHANLYLDRKDNKTPSDRYDYVILDTSNNTQSRTNLPYGYRKYGANTSLDYRISNRYKINAGYEYRQQSRTYSEVAKTKNHNYWYKNYINISKTLNMNLKLSHEQRTGSDYRVLSTIESPQNPLMRKYNLADRKRYQLGANLGYSGLRDIYLDFYLNYAADDYTESKIGLAEAKDFTYGLDVSTMLSENVSIHAFLSQERIKSDTLGAEPSNWKIESVDNFTVLGIGANWDEVIDKLDLGIDYTWAISTGENKSSGASSTTDVPKLESDRHSIELFSRYRYSESLTVKASYYMEIYDESDWHVDELTYDVNSSLVNLGSESYSYTAHFVAASVAYRF